MADLVVPLETHRGLAEAAYRARGFTEAECAAAARFCERAAWHGNRTHNLIKALHLDDRFGSRHPVRPGCVPGARVERLSGRFPVAQRWIAHRKLGQAVAFDAMETAMALADAYGVGQVAVDRAFHYLWGGGYVLEAAKRGYVGYTHCTAALAEVVPFGGTKPTLGTNPHSIALPTQNAIGFPVLVDWATSAVAMGRVQSAKREGAALPPRAAVDEDGAETTDPQRVAALLPFGGHKGYGLGLINELTAALMGGSLPTLRSRPEAAPAEEKTTPNFFFQAIHPDALDCGDFACGRSRAENVRAVVEDILGPGNEDCLLPGQIEHEAAERSERAGGLIFSGAECEQLAEIGAACGHPIDVSAFRETSA